MLTAKYFIRSMAPLNLRVSSSTRMLSTPAPKQFEDIPGPRSYPFIGTALDYRNDKYTMSNVIKKRFAEFGPIYREAIFPGLPEQVVVCDPQDVETVFRMDGEWPKRPEGGDIFKKIMKEAGISTPGLFLS